MSFLRFWSRSGYTPVYLRQTANDLTGEHSCIMLKALESDNDERWQDAYFNGQSCREIYWLGSLENKILRFLRYYLIQDYQVCKFRLSTDNNRLFVANCCPPTFN